MSYQLLSTSSPVARKNHNCIWCGEPIEKGLKHERQVIIFEGDFQMNRFHVECGQASAKYFEDDSEFIPGSFKRGTAEEK